jgi:hypothetical protein
MNPPQWEYDPNRKEHYYWDAVQQAWVYQSGLTVPASASALHLTIPTPSISVLTIIVQS